MRFRKRIAINRKDNKKEQGKRELWISGLGEISANKRVKDRERDLTSNLNSRCSSLVLNIISSVYTSVFPDGFISISFVCDVVTACASEITCVHPIL